MWSRSVVARNTVAKDWEKLAGEKGEKVSSSRLERMMKLGGMGAGVAASSFAGKMKNLITRGGDDDQELSDNLKKNAEKMADVLGELKGASMKIGQILSADPEMIPPEFAQGLERLQKSAPPMTWMTVKSQIETALDLPIEAAFRDFNPEPIGAASIGQVHRATLDTGEDVAIKVQYPGVADALESDMETLRSMLIWARPFIDRKRLNHYFDEIREVLLIEADYTREAEQLARFREHFSEKPEFRIPRPYPELTRPTVLVMEYVEGEKLDHALERLEQDERNVLLQRFIGMYVWMFHELFELHADPHPGNFMLDAEGRLVLLDFGAVRKFEPAFSDAILELLDTCWEDDPERALRIYEETGFGGENFRFGDFDPALITEYHEIVLTPFMTTGKFDFGDWKPAIESKKFMMRNPPFMKLVPPPDALLYFRVLSGIKGLLARFGAQINVYDLAVETAERRGVLTL